MGLLDDLLNQAMAGGQGGNSPVPGGIAKPLLLALSALLVGKAVGGGAAAAQPAQQPRPAANAGSGTPDGGLVGGLGGLLQKLQDAGHGETVNSWVGPGPNKPIQPGQLGAALGPNTVSTAAQQSGLSEQELLQHLAQNLPQIVSELTNNGATMPSLAQIAQALTQK
jgi:uncharacterized protein YidB (DUF937 family)